MRKGAKLLFTFFISASLMPLSPRCKTGKTAEKAAPRAAPSTFADLPAMNTPPIRQNRPLNALRPVRITRHYNRYAEGSVLIEMGHT